ncbi:15945_t:CDS:2 [Acaulospora colombiana]|uniref:15945_t:CDS:1 n=1 Tax=Acaulospora colombiana TaxID=27376 RepID=A0ACA9NDN5_9GLOM|nr:15945_t:CDS:2 [Acaulospora colombiana]
MLRAILEDFDACLLDLKLQISVDTEKDMSVLDKDLEQMKFLIRLDRETDVNGDQDYNENFVASLSTVQEQFKITESEVKNCVNPMFQVNTIPFEELENPGETDVPRGSIIKRRYKGMDVACKKVIIETDNEVQVKIFKTRVSILEKLHLCDSIIRFYGISKLGDDDYMIYGWAELRSLKEVYKNQDLSLNDKVSISLDICRGLVFLNATGIYHHDIRCKNILMTSKLEAKIANFSFSRGICDDTIKKNPESSVNWMAPEKMEEYRPTVNTKKFQYTPPWEHDPELRIELASLLDEIQNLYTCIKNTDIKSTNKVCSFNLSTVEVIPPMEHGIEAYKKKNYKEAFVVFKANSESGSSDAKFWIGELYWKGKYVEKNLDQALKYYKEAADEGHTKAKFRYAVSFHNLYFDNEPMLLENSRLIIDNLRAAAADGHEEAQYMLGEIHQEGKFGTKIDEKLAKNYYEMAATKNHKKAIEALGQIKQEEE